MLAPSAGSPPSVASPIHPCSPAPHQAHCDVPPPGYWFPGTGRARSDPTTAPTAAAGAPSVCDDLVADDALSHLGEQLRSVTIENGDSDELIASAEALRSFESTFPSATRAAAALEALAETPDDAEKTEALVDAFTDLDAEVQAECAFWSCPVRVDT